VTLCVAVSLFAVAVSMTLASSNDAYSVVSYDPCAYTGHAFVEGTPVPDGTGIKVIPTVGDTTQALTGDGILAVNQYYMGRNG